MPRAPAVTLITEQLRRTVPGGIGTYVRGLLQGLDQAGAGDSVRIWQSRLPVALRSRLWDRGIGRVAGNVVHAPTLAFPDAAGTLVVMVHDVAWREVPDAFTPRGLAWHERSFQRAARVADHFVVPSTRTADAVVIAGVPASKVTIIEEGCDHLPASDDAAAAAIVEGEFLLAVGTREPRKNLERLIDAYRRARPRFPEPWPLVIVGPRGWGDDVELGSVIATGYIEAPVLAGLYKRARAFAYVPLMEGFGLPPIEAMHAGVPVVTSNTVPSAQGAALAVEPTDVEAIAAALVAAMTDDAVRRDLVTRGAERAGQLTWRATAERHLDLWRSVSR